MIGEIFDFAGEIASGPNWRYWICVGLALVLSVIAHHIIPGTFWDWFVSIPLVLGSIFLAWRWKNG
jgi:hypothetical protein